MLVALTALAGTLAGCGSSSPTDPAGTPAAPLTYAAIGASDAVGIGAFPLSDGYVYVLGRRMDEVRGEVTVRNLGVSGTKTDEFVRDQLPQAIAADPDVVTVWAGSNDLIGGRSPERFAGDLDQLLAGLRRGTRATVFVGDLADLTQAPLFAVDPDPDVTAERVAAFNARIVAAVAAHGCVLVRLSSLSLGRDMFSIDGFHPSNTGHRRIADLYWAEIRPRL